jgi:hypothetical protein
MADLFKVKTGSVGPGGEPIFDVFEGQRHIELPEFQERNLSLDSIAEGQLPPEGAVQTSGEVFKSQFLPAVTTTDRIRDDLGDRGLTPDDVADAEDETGLQGIMDRFKATDDLVSRLVEARGPTAEEQSIEADIEELENMLKEDIEGVQERTLDGAILKSAIASEINNITQGNTRESLVLMRRMNNLNTKLARLQGNRQATFDALKLEYDISRQSITDAINFYKLTAPEQIASDESTGKIWFRNPITGEVSVTDLPGFTPREEEPTFETRTVNSRTVRFGFDSAGNIVSQTDLGQSGSDGDGPAGSIAGINISNPTLNVLEGIQSLKDLTPTQRTATITELRKLGFYDETVPDWFRPKEGVINESALAEAWRLTREKILKSISSNAKSGETPFFLE